MREKACPTESITIKFIFFVAFYFLNVMKPILQGKMFQCFWGGLFYVGNRKDGVEIDMIAKQICEERELQSFM